MGSPKNSTMSASQRGDARHMTATARPAKKTASMPPLGTRHQFLRVTQQVKE